MDLGCIVCEESFTDDDDDIRVLRCGHVFHAACLGGYQCPDCGLQDGTLFLTKIQFRAVSDKTADDLYDRIDQLVALKKQRNATIRDLERQVNDLKSQLMNTTNMEIQAIRSTLHEAHNRLGDMLGALNIGRKY